MLYVLGGLFFAVMALFVFPQFSPIPYFPANKKDLKMILKALMLRNDQVVFDLGAGDGIVIFEAAHEALKKNLNTVFVAVEINPALVLILYGRRLLHPNKRNVRIVWVDMFKKEFSIQHSAFRGATMQQYDNITIFMYISPWLMDKLLSRLKKEFKKFEVVSYFYPLPKKASGKAIMKEKSIHSIFKYEFVVS